MARAGLCRAGKNLKPGTEILLQTRQGTLAGLAWGEETGIPVLALHGWLDNAASFIPLAQHLPGIRLVALDFPGHGHSQWRPGALWYHYIDYAWDVISAADELDWQQFHILGHSLGAAVAPAVAAACPERILSLNLMEATGPLVEQESATAERLKIACSNLQKLGNRDQPVYEDIEKLIRARAVKGGIDIESARLLINRNLARVGDKLQWRSDPRLTLPSPVRMTEEQVLNLLGAVQTSTLLIEAVPPIGVFDETTLNARKEALRLTKHLLIAGHHHLHMSSPELLAEAIMEHLSGAAIL